MGFLRRRRERRATAVTVAADDLAHLPLIEQAFNDDNDSAVHELIEIRADLVTARRLARRRSLARALLGEALLWIDTWLDTWKAREVQTPHLFILYRQMVRHLEQVAERLSTVAELEARMRDVTEWPYTEPDSKEDT